MPIIAHTHCTGQGMEMGLRLGTVSIVHISPGAGMGTWLGKFYACLHFLNKTLLLQCASVILSVMIKHTTWHCK